MKSFFPIVCLGVLLAGTPSWVVAWPGMAQSFNGTNQYISATIPALPYNYTISAWVYIRSGGTDSNYIGVLTGTNCGSSIELMIHGTNSSSTGLQYLELGRCGSFSGELSSQTVPLKLWTHIAVVVGYLNTAVTYYVNGNVAHTWDPGGANMYLGPDIHLADNVTRHFNGRLDEVQIWNRALSQAEIRTNMYRAPKLPDSNLVAYWPMVMDAGNIFTPDGSGHGRAGLLSTNRPLPTISVSTWPLNIGVREGNPYTNECHAGFTDPGAFVSNAPADMAAGNSFNLVLKSDRTITGWGNNTYGQLDAPSTATNMVALAAGFNHALALRIDGALFSWGRDISGETEPPSSATNVVAISAGGAFSLALRADGTVVGWGDNSSGKAIPPSWATNVVAIAAGGSHSLALKSDGTIVTWGNNYYGQVNIPSSVTSDVVAIAAGYEFSMALKSNGTVVAWGYNEDGEANVPATATNVVGIAAGMYHGLALRKNGTVVAWGYNSSGQTNVPASATNVVRVLAGGDRSVAIKADGTLLVWGSYGATPNEMYQLYKFAFTTNGVVDTNTVGSYSLTYTVKNSLSTSTVTRTVEVVDTTAPVLTRLGTNPTVVAVGTPYVDPGATAIDACGGDFTAAIETNGWVDSNVSGAYTQTYTAVDSYSNTGRIQRAIWVADVPSIDNLSNVFILAHTVPGTHGARFYADVAVKGVAVGTWFQYGVSTNYSDTGPTSSLVAGYYITNRVLSLSNLPYGVTYHWRVVATSSLGEAVSPDQVAEWAAGAPVISGYAASLLTTNTTTMTREVVLQAVANPNGPESIAYFQFGPDTDYPWNSTTNNLPAGYADSNLIASLSNLGPGIIYHWRVVATNMLGVIASDDQVLEVPSPYARGDFDGDGVVEQGELNDVYGGYWQDNPTQITNAMGLGRTEVKLVVDNLIGWDLTAQYSDDLATWSNLSNRAIPVFQFTDPDATNHPTRTYRLLAP